MPATDGTIKVITPSQHRVTMVTMLSAWTDAIAAGGMDDADNGGSTIDNPGAIASGSHADHTLFDLKDGTNILQRLKYDSATTVVGVAPVVQWFGRDDENGKWMRLYNRASTPAHEITITPAPAAAGDLNDTTNKWTSVDIKTGTHVIDRAGCRYVMATVKTAIGTLTGGSAANVTLEAMII